VANFTGGKIAEPVAAGPVAPSERILALDVLRGFAVLGILIMNVQSMAMISAAYINPTAYGDLSGINWWVWAWSHLFADQKFMTIFSILFGAGVLLVAARAEAAGRSPFRIHGRRIFWLLLIGLAHAYLLWFGDILVTYAICGMVAYLFCRLPVKKLIVLGVGLIGVASLLYAFFAWSMQFWPPDNLGETLSMWQPGPEAVQAEVDAYRGGWRDQMQHRVPAALSFQTFLLLIWSFWRVTGLMLVGMALLKAGVLGGARSARFYGVMAIVGFGIGLPLVGLGIHRNLAAGWAFDYSMFTGWQYNYWGSLAVAAGYIGLVLLFVLRRPGAWLVQRLSAVGRMAFTNYIAQTVIVTFIFYGHGLGLFGRVSRASQLLVVLAVWILQLLVSTAWLNAFHYGPVEWLWRALTYGRRPAFRRRAAHVGA
jgi:uncharacterized protein